MVSVVESPFSPSRVVQRLTKDRTKILSEVLGLAKSLNVPEPEQSASSCAWARLFLIQASRLGQDTHSLLKKVDDLAKFELVMSNQREAERYVVLCHCKVVGATLDSLASSFAQAFGGEISTSQLTSSSSSGRESLSLVVSGGQSISSSGVTNGGKTVSSARDVTSIDLLQGTSFDYIIADDCCTQMDLVILSPLCSATTKVICFGKDERPQFNCHLVQMKGMAFEPREFAPGLHRKFTRKTVASLKEEVDWIVALVSFAVKIGYDWRDIVLVSLSLKQARALEEALKKSSIPLAVCVFDEAIKHLRPRVRVVLVATGGGNQDKQMIVDSLSHLCLQALIIISSDKEWATPKRFQIPSHLQDGTMEEDSLELIIGERVGEDFDEELRTNTKYKVAKSSDLLSVVASM